MLTKLYVLLQRYFAGDEGATAVEYGLMVALIAVVIIGAVAAVGGALDDVFQDVGEALGVVAG